MTPFISLCSRGLVIIYCTKIIWYCEPLHPPRTCIHVFQNASSTPNSSHMFPQHMGVISEEMELLAGTECSCPVV